MKLVLLLIAFYQMSLFASEVDSFTLRNQKLSDATEIINKKANHFLQEALERANSAPGCNEKTLLQELQKDFSSHYKGSRLIDYIVQSDEVPKHFVPRKESIYKHHKITDGRLLGSKKADSSGWGVGVSLVFGNHYIGSDKFEHIFGQGFKYYSWTYDKKWKLEKVFKRGIFKERTVLGGNPLATGVFSFADLVANFQGMRFWNHMLQKNEDILGENIGPYVLCENQKWVQKKQIDFSAYFDDAMDEGMHCAALATKHGYAGVMKVLNELKVSCPLNPLKIEAAKQKYEIPFGSKKLSDYLFNPYGKIHKYRRLWYK